MTIDGFGLKDDEFWSDPEKNRTEILRGLRREKFDGFVIDGPKQVDLARTSLPLTLLRAGSYRQVWSLGLDDGVLVAVDLDRNEVLAVPLRDYEAERPDEPVDLDQAPEGYLATWVPSDLREMLELEWHTRRLLVTAIVRDRTSNRVLISVGDSVAAGLDPAVADYVRKAWSQDPSTRVDPLPEADVPSYSARTESPVIPETPGIALAIDRVGEARPGTRSVVHGAFRVPVAPHDTNVGEGLRVGPPGGPQRAPTAVVAITLLTTANKEPGPRLRALLVPSFEPVVRTKDGAYAIGYFAVDLRRLGVVETAAQTNYLYAFSREVMAGPVPHALIDPALLPPARPAQ